MVLDEMSLRWFIGLKNELFPDSNESWEKKETLPIPLKIKKKAIIG